MVEIFMQIKGLEENFMSAANTNLDGIWRLLSNPIS